MHKKDPILAQKDHYLRSKPPKNRVKIGSLMAWSSAAVPSQDQKGPFLTLFLAQKELYLRSKPPKNRVKKGSFLPLIFDPPSPFLRFLLGLAQGGSKMTCALCQKGVKNGPFLGVFDHILGPNALLLRLRPLKKGVKIGSFMAWYHGTVPSQGSK